MEWHDFLDSSYPRFITLFILTKIFTVLFVYLKELNTQKNVVRKIYRSVSARADTMCNYLGIFEKGNHLSVLIFLFFNLFFRIGSWRLGRLQSCLQALCNLVFHLYCRSTRIWSWYSWFNSGKKNSILIFFMSILKQYYFDKYQGVCWGTW